MLPFAELAVGQVVPALVIVAVAYFVRGVAGFGSGLIAVPLLLLVGMPLTQAVPLIVLLDYLASASHGVANRQAISWRTVLPTLPFMVLGVAAALILFKTVDLKWLTKALAVFIIAFAFYQLFARAPARSESRLWAIPAGGFGGLIGTLFGTGGPFYVAYLQLRGLDKTAFRATFATLYLIDGGNRIAGYLLTGLYDLVSLAWLALLLPVMALFLYLGGHVHTRLTQEAFKRGISALLVVSGIALLLK